jgi:DNA-binding GntR family transcriptional regulator
METGEGMSAREGRTAGISGAAPRLYQRAFDILARQIREGEIMPGASLHESGIASMFGISRAPARRALAELLREGLVSKAEGRGYRVLAANGPAILRSSGDRAGEPLRLSSAASWERIYNDVEDEIIARISFAGWRVNEAELARHYGVSRTVARDVLARLQQRGLVRKDESARWYAPALTAKHVGELYELRWLLEPVALVKAASSLPKSLVARMRSRVETAIANAHLIGGDTLDALEQDLHVTLLGYCGNGPLMQALTLPQSLLIAHRFLYRWTPRLFDTEPFLPEHLDILGKLEAGHVDEAARALEHHLKVSSGRAVARVGAIVQSFAPDPLPYMERVRQA